MQIILLNAIFLLAFVAFLRLGEILIRSKAHSEKVLQVADVAINYEKGTPANLNITLRLSKNIKTSQPALFPIIANEKNHNLCPVQAIHEYIQLFKPIQGPLFQFLGNSPVMHSFVSSKLHTLLQELEREPCMGLSNCIYSYIACTGHKLGFLPLAVIEKGQVGLP